MASEPHNSAFDELPNKRAGGDTKDVWPNLGPDFVLNRFYRQFDGAEGWYGVGYLAIWSEKEIAGYRLGTLEAYPEKYHFFASDGGGTLFGFVESVGDVDFCSAPDIGEEEDVRILGDWPHFVEAIRCGDYI